MFFFWVSVMFFLGVRDVFLGVRDVFFGCP